MAENRDKPDSGGAAYIARQFVENLRQTYDAQAQDIKDNRDEITELRVSFANLTGKLAIITIFVSLLVSGIVTFIIQALRH